jgi:hypothetical protein
MKSNTTYAFSFTAASSLINETIVVAERFFQTNDWDETYQSILKENLLNKVKKETIRREFREIKKRLDLLTHPQLQLLISGNSDDAKTMIFLAIIKAYSFIHDFMIEVLRVKYLSGDTLLLETDYKNFVEAKMVHHPELNEISPTTIYKTKQVLFNILMQTGFLSLRHEKKITRPMLSSDSLNVIMQNNKNFLKLFLYSDDEIERLKG